MRKIVFVAVCLASLLIIKNLLTSIYTLWQKQDLIVKAQRELDKEKRKNEALKKDLVKANSPQFVEEEARNKLFLVKQGEQEIIIPQSLLSGSSSASVNKGETPANWEKWWKLFF